MNIEPDPEDCRRRYTNEERHAAIRWVSDKVDHPTTTEEYRKHKLDEMPSERAITRPYRDRNSPWLAALWAAGLDADPKRHNATPTKKDIRDSYVEAAAQLTVWPSPDQYRSLGYWPSVTTIYNHYESWGSLREAVKAEFRLVSRLVDGETIYTKDLHYRSLPSVTRQVTKKVQTDEGTLLCLIGATE